MLGPAGGGVVPDLKGQVQEATATYRELAKIAGWGRPTVTSGLGDLAGTRAASRRRSRSSPTGAAADLAAEEPGPRSRQVRRAGVRAAPARAEAAPPPPRQRQALAPSKGVEDPIPRGAGHRRGGGGPGRRARRRQPGLRAPGRAAGVREESRGGSRDEEGDDRRRRSGHSQRRTRSSTPGSAASIWAAPTWRPALSRRPTRSSIAASGAAARRCRCSSTRSPRTATFRRCTTTRAGCVKG